MRIIKKDKIIAFVDNNQLLWRKIAIRFGDRVSKMYLIESDPIWAECLERTFYPFKDKVVICNKALARYDSQTTII